MNWLLYDNGLRHERVKKMINPQYFLTNCDISLRFSEQALQGNSSITAVKPAVLNSLTIFFKFRSA